MTKVEFLERWSKKATGGSAVEGFEVDVEKLIRTVVRVSTSAVVNGMLKGIDGMKEQERFRKMIEEISPAVERALSKLYK